MVELRNLSAGYPNHPVLDDITLSIPEGQVSVILGPNGCGKTTLLKTLCGILTPQKGEIRFWGEDLRALSPQQLAQKVAYLAQGRQIPDITVQRLVLHGRFPYLHYPRRYGKADYDHVQQAMEAMEIAHLADVPVQKLSGGQQQKVYLAMALAQDTPVVLLDEPTTYLDITHQMQAMEQAKALTALGKTVVMILHDLPGALRTADNLILMAEGRILAQGTPDALYTGGQIQQLFGVKLGRTQTDSGWCYYCMG